MGTGAVRGLWALLLIAGCGLSPNATADTGGSAVAADEPADIPDAAPHPSGRTRPAAGGVDSDADGLCDGTEQRYATNAESSDSDGDGLPDYIEVLNNFDASDPGSPAEDQVAELQGDVGATLDFPVRVTVDGDGSTLTGYFEVGGSVYADGASAADFAQATSAVEANPVDAARRVEPGSARFASVLGRSRLRFSVRFEFPDGADPVTCGRGYPFRYGVKKDDGSTVSDRLFLLLVSPRAGRKFCVPTTCR